MMQVEWFAKILDHLSEGVLVMDSDRNILYINQLALSMTGWKQGETVPYCSYCRLRIGTPAAERCLLTDKNPLPFFYANVPTSNGMTPFQMSTNPLTFDGVQHIVLVLRNGKWRQDDQNRKMSEILVKETMLAQEAERKRISMELHDNIGQSIYSTFLGLQGLKHLIKEEKYQKYQKHLQNMEIGLERTLVDVKKISKELHPSLLEHLGLEKALLSAIDDWKQAYQIEIEGNIDNLDESLLTRDVSLQLFRVVQEAVHNSVNHGKATHVTVIVYATDRLLHFKIIDDGVGFEPNEKSLTGLGISHMTQRMEMLGGGIRFHSRAGGPTIVEGHTPLHQEVMYECSYR